MKYRQMTPGCTGPWPAQQRGKHHHEQRKLLMRNAQDIHGRGNHSKQLALNYIFSDCKLLLTASLPSLQLTFLTKGHLLTSTPRFPGCVEPEPGGMAPCILSHRGSQARPLRQGEEAINASLQSKSAWGGDMGAAGCLRPT